MKKVLITLFALALIASESQAGGAVARGGGTRVAVRVHGGSGGFGHVGVGVGRVGFGRVGFGGAFFGSGFNRRFGVGFGRSFGVGYGVGGIGYGAVIGGGGLNYGAALGGCGVAIQPALIAAPVVTTTTFSTFGASYGVGLGAGVCP